MKLEEAITICKHIVQNFNDMRKYELPPHKFVINSEDSDAIETLLQTSEKLQQDNYKLDRENQLLFESQINSIPINKLKQLLNETIEENKENMKLYLQKDLDEESRKDIHQYGVYLKHKIEVLQEILGDK